MEMYRIAVEYIDGGIKVFLRLLPSDRTGQVLCPRIIVPEGMRVKTPHIGMIELVPTRKPCPIQWEYIPTEYAYAAMDKDRHWFIHATAPKLVNGTWEVPTGCQSAVHIPLKTTDIPFQDSLYCRNEV